MPINPAVHKALKEYLKVRSTERGPMLPNSLLMLSKGLKPITRQRARQIITEADRTVGLPNLLGTHSLRKTFGDHMYQKSGRNADMIQKMLNHSQSGTTLRYIGSKERKLTTSAMT